MSGDGSEAAPVGRSSDRFPAERFGALVRRLPRYLRLSWALASEPSLPRSRRLGVLAAAAYLASPVDLVPGFVPVVGQLDDLAVAMLALRAALRALDEPTRTRLMAGAGVAAADLDSDLATVAETARWLVRRGVRITRRLVSLVAATALTAGRAGARRAPAVGARVASGAGSGLRGLGGAVRRGSAQAARAVRDRRGSSGSGPR
jgi:uncharacterized membrane protein YkvA (DUF1232 family)